MRHNRDEKRFDMNPGHLKAVMSNMTRDLVTVGRIRTTTPRAKMLRRYAERMITLGKDGTLAARRRAMAFLRDKTVVTRLFESVAPLYKERNGGYTRILKLGVRPGDNAHMSIIELVGNQTEAIAQSAKPKKAVKKTAVKPKAAAKPKVKAPARTAEKAQRTAGAMPSAKKPAQKKAAAKTTRKAKGD